MQIIKEQLGKINHFLIIIIPLFIVNAIFNLKYNWGGVSAIARVYIMVLSFYLIFIFSQISVSEYEPKYIARYGRKGKYYLFFVLRIFPFLFIYALTIIFTVINYLNVPSWPLEPLFRVLDGRYSNTIFYSLILFLVLKQKKRPGISIPLFIIFSIIYFVADHELYAIFEPGPGVILIKLIKYFVFIFVLIYGYSKGKWVLLKSIILSFIIGSLSYFTVLSILVFSFFISHPGSPALTISGRILLKSGFVYTLDKLQKNVLEHGTYSDIENIFQAIETYGKESTYTAGEMESIIRKNSIESVDYIFNYLNKKKIKLNFETVKQYAIEKLPDAPSDAARLTYFARHLSLYYPENKKDFFELYKSGKDSMKIIVLISLSDTKDADAVNFLIDKVTSVELLRAETAYNSLVKITGKDPSAQLKKSKNDIDVIAFFRDYSSKMK